MQVDGTKNGFRPDMVAAAIPTQERMTLPHTLCTIKNTSTEITHTVIDRRLQGHELKPGASKKDVELLNIDVEHFMRMAPHHHVVVDPGVTVRDDAGDGRPQRERPQREGRVSRER